MGYTERARSSASDSRHPVQPAGASPVRGAAIDAHKGHQGAPQQPQQQGGRVVAALPLATGVERDRRDGIDEPVWRHDGSGLGERFEECADTRELRFQQRTAGDAVEAERCTQGLKR